MPKEKTVRKLRSCPACPGCQYSNIYSHIKTTHRLQTTSLKNLKKTTANQEFACALAKTLKTNNELQAKLLLRNIKDDKPDTKTIRCTVCKTKCIINVSGFKKHLSIFHAFKHLLHEASQNDIYDRQSSSPLSARHCANNNALVPSDNESINNNSVSSPIAPKPILQKATIRMQLSPRIVSKPTGLRLGFFRKISENSPTDLSRASTSSESVTTSPFLRKTDSLNVLIGSCSSDDSSIVNDYEQPPKKKMRLDESHLLEDETLTNLSEPIPEQPHSPLGCNFEENVDHENNIDYQSATTNNADASTSICKDNVIANERDTSTVSAQSTQIQTTETSSQELNESSEDSIISHQLKTEDSSFQWETPPESPTIFCSNYAEIKSEQTEKKINFKCCACPGSQFLNLENHIVKKHKLINNEESKTFAETLKTNNLTSAKDLITTILNSLPDQKKMSCIFCDVLVDTIFFKLHLTGFHNLSCLINQNESNEKSIEIQHVIIDLTLDDETNAVQEQNSSSKTIAKSTSNDVMSIKSEPGTSAQEDFFQTPPGSPHNLQESNEVELPLIKSCDELVKVEANLTHSENENSQSFDAEIQESDQNSVRPKKKKTSAVNKAESQSANPDSSQNRTRAQRRKRTRMSHPST